jgi:hypothetical protein
VGGREEGAGQAGCGIEWDMSGLSGASLSHNWEELSGCNRGGDGREACFRRMYGEHPHLQLHLQPSTQQRL